MTINFDARRFVTIPIRACKLPPKPGVAIPIRRSDTDAGAQAGQMSGAESLPSPSVVCIEAGKAAVMSEMSARRAPSWLGRRRVLFWLWLRDE